MNALRRAVLEARARRLGPWATRFEVDGAAFGGSWDPSHDARLDRFVAAFPQAKAVLELGSLEGGLAFALARRRPGLRVVAVDQRPENEAKARLVGRVLGVGAVEPRTADLDVVPPAWFGRFDAVLCTALPHLLHPGRLLDGLPAAAPGVLLWGHYAATAEAHHAVDGTPGRWYHAPEPYSPASGTTRRAFWPTLPALVDRLRTAGYADVDVVDDEPGHPNGPAVTVLARTVRPRPAP